jgi:kinesin family protein 11
MSIHSILSFCMLLKATEELQGRLGKLKTMYGSGVKALDDITGKLEENSQSTFGDLNSEVSKHSSALENVIYFICYFL